MRPEEMSVAELQENIAMYQDMETAILATDPIKNAAGLAVVYQCLADLNVALGVAVAREALLTPTGGEVAALVLTPQAAPQDAPKAATVAA